ncbi:M16 family metallopeptidase [Methylovirgula sp. 4M-Z18]|uniref:M16 family metallopeptidase n=1 Tax=Methylovirgula sp. 4M-Z18 TaxID=2293567 RepID=UPI000E2E4504|nr:pitrilysin family protein [Methylovirgula sp. 4M-Z18]RFB78855.1 insulinase family protein [Methylovirgula sp. 4M-Z18]
MSVEITTLPSGLRVVTDKMSHVETTSLGVWIGAGSRHERPQEHGLSHLLEHMAFKGTKKRSARDIAEEIETAGGDINAATSVEQTSYYARVLAEDTDLAIDILSDILTNSVFDPTELAREKSVILQEIGAAADTPDDLVFDMFTATAYPDQSIGRPILGTPERVSSFDPTAIRDYLGSHYHSESMTVAAAGAVDHKALVAEIGERFGHLPEPMRLQKEPAKYVGGENKLKKRLEQAHIIIGFEGVSFNDPRNYAAHIFANVAGGGMSSRLFQDVREKRGLAYSIYAFHWAFSDTGLFGLYAGTSAGDVTELMPVALDCLADAAADLSEVEVQRAKAQMKVSLLTALESSTARAEQIARQMLSYGRVLTRQEVIDRIDAITVDDIRAAGQEILKTAPTVCAIGPVAKVWTPDKVAARLSGV